MSDDHNIRDGIVLRLCQGNTCSNGYDEILAAAEEAIASIPGASDEVGLATESCYGRCFTACNLLVERWRNGERNDKAMLALMMNLPHPDLAFETHVKPEDLRSLVRHHLRAWRNHRDAAEDMVEPPADD